MTARVDQQLVGIARGAALASQVLQPRRRAAQAQRRHLGLLQHQAHVPVERQCRHSSAPSPAGASCCRRRAASAGSRRSRGADHDPELVLAVPDPAPSTIERPRRLPRSAMPMRLRLSRGAHPVSDELLDRDRQPEIGLQDRHQARCRTRLVGQQAGEMQLGEVADLVASAQAGRRCRTGCPRSRKAVAVGAVQADDRLGAGARAVEQRTASGGGRRRGRPAAWVAAMAQAVAHVFGQVQRQRAVGAEQAEEVHGQARPPSPSRGEKAQRAGWKDSDGSWPKRTASSRGRSERRCAAGPDGRSRCRRRAWKKSMRAARVSSRLELYRIAHAPSLAGQRMMVAAPDRPDGGLGKRIDRHVLREELAQHRAQHEGAGALEGGVVHRHGDLRCRARR
jgi:hypothetical protein